MADKIDFEFMQKAVDCSKNAPAKATCFRVGAVLVDSKRNLIASGYTLEFGEGWHAEEVAIKKAIDAGVDIKGTTIYSSLEPCSVRKSRKSDCSSLLILKGIAQVFYALAEPPVFVVCEGENKLKKAGIKTERIKEFDEEVKEINKHLKF
jgi:pyrimidine deaminase RibD-like protein